MNLPRQEIYSYVLLAVAVVILAASLMASNVVLVLVTAAVLLASVAVLKLWYVIEAFIFRRTNLIQVFDGYELSGDRQSAIARHDGKISATSAALLVVGSAAEVDREKVEGIISRVSCPFKYCMVVERLEMAKILDRLQTERNMKEISLSRLDSTNKGIAVANQLKREIEQVEHEIESITGGESPMKVAHYIMTTAVSDSLFSAEERSKSQIRELSSQFDAILKSRSRLLGGAELLELLKIDSAIVIK